MNRADVFGRPGDLLGASLGFRVVNETAQLNFAIKHVHFHLGPLHDRVLIQLGFDLRGDLLVLRISTRGFPALRHRTAGSASGSEASPKRRADGF